MSTGSICTDAKSARSMSMSRRERSLSARMPGCQPSVGFAERRQRVGHEHEAPAAEHRVERFIGQIHRLRVEDAVVRVRDAELRSAVSRRRDHRWREVRREEPSVVQSLRGKKAGIARSRGDLENTHSRSQLRVLDHPLVYRSRCGHHRFALTEPARRLTVPLFLDPLGCLARHAGKRMPDVKRRLDR